MTQLESIKGRGFFSMSIRISPLNLLLDDENPRFVVLAKKGQADIRKYLVTYEDVCQLAVAINSYGSILPGERIVVLKKDEKYVVIEGNRRTCSLQMLLNRELIPDGFFHKIPASSVEIKKNCQTIEVDVLPNRNAGLELMTKRHIEGVKQWKPIAKKQFFASNFKSGISIQNLAKITGIKESIIKADIKDYKFFLSAYNRYNEDHPDFEREIIDLKIDPFLRVFKVNFDFEGVKLKPTDVLKISHDDDYNMVSQLNKDLLSKIVQLVFYETIITEKINTRNVLNDVEGIMPFLKQAISVTEENKEDEDDSILDDKPTEPKEKLGNGNINGVSGSESETGTKAKTPIDGNKNGGTGGVGGPSSGGPPPRIFFETINWNGKLKPENPDHEGLLAALDELYKLSSCKCGGKKSYYLFPIAAGMILRTVYEQALMLRLKDVGLWGKYYQTISGNFPTLSGIEGFIKAGANKQSVLPTKEMVDSFDRVIAATQRDFLNANIHNPGNIRVTPHALEGIACSGMFNLIQSIINILL
jgi:hypothetical protein